MKSRNTACHQNILYTSVQKTFLPKVGYKLSRFTIKIYCKLDYKFGYT